MANVNAVWGIDIGQCALKALRVQMAADGTAEITHFDVIEHPKILSQPDSDADELIRNALDKFLSRNEISGTRVALSVPGQSSFARFIKLPPVEAKRIPEIVRFEAVQQIPFDIEEVEWDYQTFSSPASPDVEVGIFAMRKELVFKHLSHLRQANIDADIVQLAPLCHYNMMVYDGQTAKQGATILIDVGAANTDLVISDGERIWLRSIPLGGNNFTDSLVKAFKLSFSKAENLKRTAATSKYARQIFVAMRPVFGDLVGEVQRSIGFYTSLHRDAQIGRVVCMGNAFRLPGLQKYLEQNLQVETVRPTAFNKLKPSAMINAPAFAENVFNFGIVYGLGLQGLGQSPIQCNLLPVSILRQRKWRSQRPWFAAAAGLMIAGVSVAGWGAGKTSGRVHQIYADAAGYANPVTAEHRKIQADVQQVMNQGEAEKRQIQEIKQITGYRDIVVEVAALVQNSLPNEWRRAALLTASKETPKPIEKTTWLDVVTLFKKKPELREQSEFYFIEKMQLEYYNGKPPVRERPGAETAAPEEEAPVRPAAKTATRTVAAAGAEAQEKYFRVIITGLTSVSESRIAGQIRDKFLRQMLEMKRRDEESPEGERMLSHLVLDEQSINNALEGWVNVVPRESWPKPAVAPVPGVAPVVAPEAAPSQPLSLDPMGLENYKDLRFTICFDMKIKPPVAPPPQEPAARPGRGARKP